ncbi:hypothetical protein PV327_011676, partial [Microctonus hyperodae]
IITKGVSDLIPEHLQPLMLSNEGKMFNLLVTKEETNKALEDESFCMSLLQIHKNNYFNIFNDDNTNEEPVNNTPRKSEEENVEFHLNEKSKKKKKISNTAQEKTKPCVWRDDEILLLLSSYGQYQKSYNNGKITHLKFWKLITEEMTAHDIDKTCEQCIIKMENF